MNLQANINQIVGKIADINTKKKMASELEKGNLEKINMQKEKMAMQRERLDLSKQRFEYQKTKPNGLSMAQVEQIINSREQAMFRVQEQVKNEYRQKQAFKTRIANLKKRVATLEGGSK